MEYRGCLKGYPKKVVDWMLDQQEKAGNKRDVTVFERNNRAAKGVGGFNWTPFEHDLIGNKQFHLIPDFETDNSAKEELKDILIAFKDLEVRLNDLMNRL